MGGENGRCSWVDNSSSFVKVNRERGLWCGRRGVREEFEVGVGKVRFIPGGMFQKRENFKNKVLW